MAKTAIAGGRLHFIGIGGAGMSSLAHVYLNLGYKVSGSDIKESANTKALADAGADIAIGHSAAGVKGAGTVVVSSAIGPNNPELVYAKKNKLTILQRAELLDKLMQEKRGIAIAGTHGKTTTTSMAAVMMEACGLKPTYLIGGELNDIGSGARYDSGEYLVAEADESDASLLMYEPEIAVVTNIEADHLDFYESLDEIKDVFKKFLNRLPDDGLAIVCLDSPALKEVIGEVKCHLKTYSLDGEGEYRAARIKMTPDGSSFDVVAEGRRLGRVKISAPGIHNVANALAVIVLGLSLGLSFGEVSSGLAAYTGVRRRFQVKGVAGEITVVDDYAHHPSEVAATLKAARTGDWRKVVTVFQPHRYSRTKFLYADFGRVFTDADEVIITDVYGAGEEPLPGVDGKLIVDSILETEPYKQVAYFPKKSDAGSYLAHRLRDGDILLTMGAGDVWALGEEVLEELKTR